MVRIGKEVFADNRMHPAGTLLFEGPLRRESRQDASEISVSGGPDLVSKVLERFVPSLFVFGVSSEKLGVPELEVLRIESG